MKLIYKLLKKNQTNMKNLKSFNNFIFESEEDMDDPMDMIDKKSSSNVEVDTINNPIWNGLSYYLSKVGKPKKIMWNDEEYTKANPDGKLVGNASLNWGSHATKGGGEIGLSIYSYKPGISVSFADSNPKTIKKVSDVLGKYFKNKKQIEQTRLKDGRYLIEADYGSSQMRGSGFGMTDKQVAQCVEEVLKVTGLAGGMSGDMKIKQM
jgi:hypothetical protein